ncbi:MAG: hypothetical protein MR568_05305 [Eisenbergiella massiliensis]|nr:hypothetical protein [Eisenbergiella massiliensis]
MELIKKLKWRIPGLLPGRPFFTKGMPGIMSGILTIRENFFISAGNEPGSHACMDIW